MIIIEVPGRRARSTWFAVRTKRLALRRLSLFDQMTERAQRRCIRYRVENRIFRRAVMAVPIPAGNDENVIPFPG
jgi:hypothetical protein